jgi:uncharacterized protein YjbI with pentapeptide repeats
LIVVVVVLGLWGGFAIGASVPALADTVIGSCTIVSNPTPILFTNCPGANLAGANLTGLDLSYANLSGADLSEANLTNVNLYNANLDNAILTGATVTGTMFNGINGGPVGITTGGLVGTPASLPSDGPNAPWLLVNGYLIGSGANVTGATLTGIDLSMRTYTSVNLTNANLSSAIFQYTSLTSSTLVGANLTGAGFYDSSLYNDNLTGANLTNTNHSTTDFGLANLTNAILTGASLLFSTRLGDATLTGVRSGGVTGDPTLPVGWSLVSGYLVGPGANLTGALLSGANLTNATLTGANLSGANLSGATLTGVTSGGITGTPAALPAGWTLVDGYLIGPGANLTGANLTGADLTNANLTNAILTNANLSGTNLTGATLTGVTSGGITGMPAALPAGWTLVDGYLLAPGMHLLTITADNTSMVYGHPLPAFTYSVSGLVNGDPPSVVTGVVCTTTATSTSGVGSYPITCSGGTAPNYYVLNHQPGTLTIGQAPLTITADSKRADPGQPFPAFTYSVSGLLNGDAQSVVTRVVCTTTATSTSGPGTYPITCSGGTATNYALTYVPGTLTIGPAPATIAADNKTIVYGQPLPAFTYSVLGLLNGDPPSVVTGVVCTSTATSTPAAGTYPITCSGGTATNYVLSYQPGTLTISKAPVTITADNKTIVYGQPLPGFTYSVSGLLNGDPPSVVTGVVCTSTATSTSPGGAYPITCSGGTATNYAPIYQPGTLLISYNVSFSAPLPNTVFRPGSSIPVKFQLTASNGQPLPNSVAASLGCAVTATFSNTGPVCATYNAKKRQLFQAMIATPTALTRGASYPITVQVTAGTFVVAAATLNVIAK